MENEDNIKLNGIRMGQKWRQAFKTKVITQVHHHLFTFCLNRVWFGNQQMQQTHLKMHGIS